MINQLLDKGESETVEFKRSTAQIERALRSICGLLNHKGGTVYFGISDKNELIGQDVSDSTLKSLSQKVRQRIKPEISPEIKVLEFKNKKVIEVRIKEGTNKPYYLNSIAYKRIGSESPPIPPEELERIILAKNKIQWDSQICEEASLDDIDEEKVKWFLKKAKSERGLKVIEDIPVEKALIKLKLLQGEKLTNVAMLLFAKEPWFLQSEIKCIRFSGNEPVKPYIDFQTIEGNTVDLVDRAEDFVLRNTKKAIWLIPGQIQREEKYEYPLDAIREAIVNAVVHRDWESPSKVQVRIFDNRIEIWSPGLLPSDITIEDLRREHRSIPRNPLLFKQFFWIKYVEDVGGGTIDMINECRQWGIPEPEFKYITGAFVVIFRLFPSIEDLKKSGLNEKQIKTIKYIEAHGKITRSEYEKLCLVSSRTANREIEELLRKGLIEKKGRGPEIHYCLASFGELWRDMWVDRKE